MKNVLLIGDSIRIGYQPFVTSELGSAANVAGPEDNCRFAKYTLWYIDYWIAQAGKPDVIHWNNGLWDVYHVDGEERAFTTVDEYVATMARVLERLKLVGAPIVWATTTPVSSDHPNCRNEEIESYNEAAVKLMQAEGITINDLNAVIAADKDACIGDDGMHLTERGSRACAEAVVLALKPYL